MTRVFLKLQIRNFDTKAQIRFFSSVRKCEYTADFLGVHSS
jgi:hypothetical protein